MTSFRLSRRAVLRGAGSIAIALPWLEIMREERPAHAAGVPARRFVGVYTPGGTVHEFDAGTHFPEQWSPTGTETDFALSRILAPFAPVKSELLVVGGVDMRSAIGEQQQSGLIAWLTGTNQNLESGAKSYAKGPSIDQVLSSRLAGQGALSSLELAVRWGTGKSHGKVSPMGVVSFSNDEPFTPRAPLLDPVGIWTNLFGSLNPNPAKIPSFDRSILDYVDRRYAALSAKVGAADKQRIDQHLTAIRELERNVAQSAGARCVPPALVDTSDYDPLTGLEHPSDDGSVVDLVTDAAIPKVGKLMLDMLVMALSCERTSVATFMWTDCEAKHTYPWLNLPQTFNFYQNGGGYQPEPCAQIGAWYATQNSYLLQQMAGVDMGGHSLLDESVVFFGSEVSNPATHKKDDMPFLLAGGGGGLRGGRWLKYDGVSHNDLLAAILNRFDDPALTFGDERYCSGAPLSNLT